jgi:hypothetical protein
MESTNPCERFVNPSFREKQPHRELEAIVNERHDAAPSGLSIIRQGFFGLSQFFVSLTSMKNGMEPRFLWEAGDLKRQAEIP